MRHHEEPPQVSACPQFEVRIEHVGLRSLFGPPGDCGRYVGSPGRPDLSSAVSSEVRTLEQLHVKINGRPLGRPF